MKAKLYYSILTIIVTFSLNAQQLEIYDVDLYETETKESFAFISLSDNYNVSEHPDSLTIPPSKNHLQVFKLESKYREQLLYKTKIKETDNVYIYDYFKDKLVTFKVSQLEVFACLNFYSSVDEGPFPDYYYMIGFKADKKRLGGSDDYYSNSLVYWKRKPIYQRQCEAAVMEKVTCKRVSAP